MTGISEMKLLSYQVLKTSFQLNEQYQFKSGKINIQPEFKRDVVIVDEKKYKIVLSVIISKDVIKEPIPFYAEVTISATFELNNWEDEVSNKIAVNSSTAILFPFLRTLLSTVTMNGNVPPYTLPIMNISKLFMDKEE